MAYVGLAKPTVAKLDESSGTPKYADVTLGTDTLPIQAHTVMFGHTVAKEGESGTSIKNRTTDSSNYVGLGIYMDEKVDGLKKYVAMWIYKVKFAEGQESFKTKGDNIEYQTPSIAGQAIGIDDNLWKETMIYDTEKEARDWIDEMAGIKKDQTQEGGGESGSGEPGGGEQGGEGSGGGTTSGEETGEKENGGETV